MVIGTWPALCHGCTTIIPGRGFTPAVRWKRCRTLAGTSLYGVPTMFIAEPARPGLRLLRPDHRCAPAVMAGPSRPIEVMNRAISDDEHAGSGHRLRHDGDLAGVTMTRSVDTMAERTESVGRTMPHWRASGGPDDRGGDERGQIGELCTRGYRS